MESHKKLKGQSQRGRRTKNSRLSNHSESSITSNVPERLKGIRNGKSPLTEKVIGLPTSQVIVES